MAQTALTACHRCREQKLKCSREMPTCARCAKSNLACVFPDPPDRKRLARFRAPPRKRKLGADNSLRSGQAKETSPLTDQASKPPSCQQDGDLSSERLPPNPIKEIPVSLRNFLLEVWFTCDYNSANLFHQRTFWTDVEAGTVPEHILLALCAASTSYLPTSSPLAQTNAHILKPIGNLQAVGRQWAIEAGKQVLYNIDKPTLASVQTCEILALYWHSVGESQRNVMFTGIGLQAALALGFDKLTKSNHPDTGEIDTSDTAWIEDEIKRRCFWAVWFSSSVNSDGILSNHRVMELPLPIDDDSFSSCTKVPLSTLSDRLRSLSSDERIETVPSVEAELMQLMLIWTSVGAHLQSRKRTTAKNCLAELFELDDQLSTWMSNLPSSLKYSKRGLYEKLVVKEKSGFVMVHAMYHLCRLVLHSSIVPQFSGHQPHQHVTVEAISICAKVGVKSAQAISDICSDLIALEWDMARVSPFYGYCVYVSASVLAVLLLSSDKAVANFARTKLKANLSVLKSMKAYWINLERLWVKLNELYEAQYVQPQYSSRLDMSWPKNSQEESGRIGAIEKRNIRSQNTNNMGRRFATSDAHQQQRFAAEERLPHSMSNAEKPMSSQYPNSQVSAVDESLCYSRQFQQTPPPVWDTTSWPQNIQSIPTISNDSGLQIPYKDTDTAAQGQYDSALPLFPDDGSHDWWQIELDDMTQTMLMSADLPHSDWNDMGSNRAHTTFYR